LAGEHDPQAALADPGIAQQHDFGIPIMNPFFRRL
jgi:hypothetical protein